MLKQFVRYKILFLIILSPFSWSAEIGLNYNGTLIKMEPADMERTSTKWVRAFIDYYAFSEGNKPELHKDGGIKQLKATKDAGYNIILSFKFNHHNRNFPTNINTIRDDLSYVDTVLDELYNYSDIIVAGNEPFIESKTDQRDKRLVTFYKEAANKVKAYRDTQSRKLPIYIGAFNRLWNTKERTQAVVDLFNFAKNSNWIAGIDLHVHHETMKQMEDAIKYSNGKIRSNQNILLTEYSYMKKWKKHTKNKIPKQLADKYGHPSNWKVYQYLNHCLKNPVARVEWVTFLSKSAWYESNKKYLAKTFAIFKRYPKVKIATYAAIQTAGNSFSANEDPWILNSLLVPRTVVPNPTTKEIQFGYHMINDFRNIQSGIIK